MSISGGFKDLTLRSILPEVLMDGSLQRAFHQKENTTWRFPVTKAPPTQDNWQVTAGQKVRPRKAKTLEMENLFIIYLLDLQ